MRGRRGCYEPRPRMVWLVIQITTLHHACRQMYSRCKRRFATMREMKGDPSGRQSDADLKPPQAAVVQATGVNVAGKRQSLGKAQIAPCPFKSLTERDLR